MNVSSPSQKPEVLFEFACSQRNHNTLISVSIKVRIQTVTIHLNMNIYSLTDEFNSQIHFKNKIIVSWTIAFDRCLDAGSPGCLQSLTSFSCGEKIKIV